MTLQKIARTHAHTGTNVINQFAIYKCYMEISFDSNNERQNETQIMQDQTLRLFSFEFAE